MKRPGQLYPLNEIARTQGWLDSLAFAGQRAKEEGRDHLVEKLREVQAYLMANDQLVDPRSFTPEGLGERAVSPDGFDTLKGQAHVRGWLAALPDAFHLLRKEHREVADKVGEAHRFFASTDLPAQEMPLLLARWESLAKQRWFELRELTSPVIGTYWAYEGNDCFGGFTQAQGYTRELAFADSARHAHTEKIFSGLTMKPVTNPFGVVAPEFPAGEAIYGLEQIPALAREIQLQKLVFTAETTGCPEDALEDLVIDVTSRRGADGEYDSQRSESGTWMDATDAEANRIMESGFRQQIAWLLDKQVKPRDIADHLSDSVVTPSLDML
ncbi:hypothetical protein [Geopseudomonas aromaticivorans]